MKELGFFDQAMLKLEAAGMSPIYMCGAFILEMAGSPYPVDGKVIADHDPDRAASAMRAQLGAIRQIMFGGL